MSQLKSITKVPEVDSLMDGDNLIIQRDGVASQIAARNALKPLKVIYYRSPVQTRDLPLTAPAYKDPACTQLASFDETVALLTSGVPFLLVTHSDRVNMDIAQPSYFGVNFETKTISAPIGNDIQELIFAESVV